MFVTVRLSIDLLSTNVRYILDTILADTKNKDETLESISKEESSKFRSLITLNFYFGLTDLNFGV